MAFKFSNLYYDIKKLISLEWLFARPDEFGVSDMLLPVAFCDDEAIIFNRDYSLSWSFWYSGAPYESSSSEELRYLNEQVFSKAFSLLGDNWCIHLRDTRVPSNGYIPIEECYFPDPTTYLMDWERRCKYESSDNNEFINRFVLTFTYLPTLTDEKAKSWFMENNELQSSPFVENIDKFKDTIRQVLDLLSYGVWTKPLTKLETKKYLHFCINGFEIDFKENPYDWLDLYYQLSTQDLVKGIVPRIGNFNIGVVCVGEGFPVRATPAFLHALSMLPFEYSWVTRFIFFDTPTAKKYLDKTVDYHLQAKDSDIAKSMGNKSRNDGTIRFNRAAATLAEQAEDALESADTENITFGKYTGSVVVFDKDLKSLNEKLALIEKVLLGAGFVTKIESANCLDAYFGTIPGMVRNNVRKWAMDTINLANIMPTTDTWSGYEKHPSIYYQNNNPPTFYASTREGSMFRGCSYVGDIGHRFIVGPSRAGKSVLVNFLSAQEFRYKNQQLFHFDYGYSAQVLNFACNGSFFDIITDQTSMAYKPLNLVDDEEGFNFLINWLCEIAELNLVRKVTVDEKNSITRVLEIIKANGTKEQRTMTYFYLQIKAHVKNTELEQAFVGYAGNANKQTIKSNIFNSIGDNLQLSRYSLFEMEKLMKLPEDIFIPVIRYLFHVIYKSLDGRPTLIVIEECQAFTKSQIMIDMIDDALRRFAKKSCSIALVTQQVNDLLNSPLWDVIQDQCKTKYFLPNPSLSTNESTPVLYRQFGLNDQEIRFIADATIQREYFFTNAMGSRLFNLELEDVNKCFLAKTSQSDLKAARQIKAKTKDLFGYYWLKYNKLDDVAEEWLKIYKQFNGSKELNHGR